MTLFMTGPSGGRIPYRPEGSWAKVEGKKGTSNQSQQGRRDHKKEPPPSKIKKRDKKAKTVASQVMTSQVHGLTNKTTVSEALKLFSEHKYHHMPVLSDTGVLMGLVSEGDLIQELQKNKAGKKKVSEIMETKIVCAGPESGMSELADALFQQTMSVIPIVDDKNLVVGIVSRGDLLRTITKIDALNLWK